MGKDTGVWSRQHGARDGYPDKKPVEGLEPPLLSDDEIGDLEWNSTDLEMYWVEQFKEKHPKEMEAVLQTQRANDIKWCEQKITEAVKARAEELQDGLDELNKKLDDREADLIQAKKEEREWIMRLIQGFTANTTAQRYKEDLLLYVFGESLKGGS